MKIKQDAHIIDFLVDKKVSLPTTLPGSIRSLKNASAGFCISWLESDLEEAGKTSEEAFALFDHIYRMRFYA